MSWRNTFVTPFLYGKVAGGKTMEQIAVEFQEGLGCHKPIISGLMISGVFKTGYDGEEVEWIEQSAFSVPFVVYPDVGPIIHVKPKAAGEKIG